MTTERVECLVPSVGRFSVDLVISAGFAFSLSSPDGSTSVLTAGEAGMVLSLFLPSETPVLRSEDVTGRESLETPPIGVLVLGVVGVLVVFVGLNVVARPIGFRSLMGDGCMVDLLSETSNAGLTVVLPGRVLPAKDILFAGLAILERFVSSPDAPDLAASSVDVMDAFFLCAFAGVAAPIAGVLRAAALLVGLAGGLVEGTARRFHERGSFRLCRTC